MGLTNIKEWSLLPNWFDSPGTAYFDGKIHLVGQATQAITASNKHYVLDINGNLLHDITAPFSARAESLVSTLNGKLYCIGGTTTQDVWEFDPTIAGYTAGSWSLTNASFVASIGDRIMAGGCDANGWFYIFGGWNQSTVYKTQNFTSWTLVGNLPANIDKISGCASFFFGGKIWVIGGSKTFGTTVTDYYNGAVDGHVYSLDVSTDTWALVNTDKERFGQCWIDGFTDGTSMFILKGYISSAQFSTYGVTNAVQGNNRGLMKSTDGITWTDLSLYDGFTFLFERHRAGVVNAGANGYIIGGFQGNDMWRVNSL